MVEVATAEKYAQDAIQEFQRENESDAQILALAFLSRSLVQQGRIVEAQSADAKGNSLPEKSSDEATHLIFEVDSAFVLAAAKDFSCAKHLAKSAQAEAKRLGFVKTHVDASLALGKIQVMGRSPAKGRVLLKQLVKDACAKGFALIAKKASAALEFKSTEWFPSSRQNFARPMLRG